MAVREKWTLRFLPMAVIGFLLLAHAGATLPAASPSEVKPAPKQEYVTYQFGAAQWLNAPRTVEMSQGVTFGQDDATLKTDAAIALLDGEQHLLSAESRGPVHIYDPQNDLTGKQGSIDFTHHLAKLQNSVVLVVKPGKQDANSSSLRKQFKDPATLTCAAMTYDYRRKIGRVPGLLTVRQVIQDKDGTLTRTLTADAGLYNGAAHTIQLVGDIRGEYSDGSKIVADTRPSGKPVVIGIQEGAEYIHIPFKMVGRFNVKQDDSSGQWTSSDSTPDTDLRVPTPPPSSRNAAPPTPPTGENAVPPASAPPPEAAVKP